MRICHVRIKYDNRYRQLRFQFLVELIMSQIMVEAFAKSLIDKIMLEAFGVINTNGEKLQILDNRQESTGIQSQASRTAQQMQDHLRTDRNEPETPDLVEMLRGLHNIQIGDSTSVPSYLSQLEEQVKHVVHGIDNVSLGEPTKLTETNTTQGQGDVHQITHDAVIETAVNSAGSRLEKESDSSNEATKVSVSLLYRMIEELETKAEKSGQKKGIEPKSISKEKIANWEEAEEQFIRTIENVDNPDQNNVDFSVEGGSRNNICDLGYEGTTSPFVVHSTAFVKNTSLEEVAIEEITSLPLPDQKDDCSTEVGSSRSNRESCDLAGSEERRPKKKGVLSRTRKLLRTIFGRRKK